MSERINGRRVLVENTYPPIPIRNFDWCAYFASNDIGDPQGYGATRQEALDDLREKVQADTLGWYEQLQGDE